MLVQEFLEASADPAPDKVGLICGGWRLTYAEIETVGGTDREIDGDQWRPRNSDLLE